jgi:pimeloyl-ACP methyl ester carboxylesterase
MTAVAEKRLTETPATPRLALGQGLAIAAAVVSGAAAAAKTVNQIIANKAAFSPPSFDAEESCYEWTEGNIRFTCSGSANHSLGTLLLVHGPGMGASACEWRSNVGPLSEEFRVYTCDLLGFGRSDKPALHYTSELYVRMLRDFIRDVIGRPVNLLASHLSAAYGVALAYREPAWFHQLFLVCPTGIRTMAKRPTPMGRNLYRTLSTPIVGESLYNSLMSHTKIENALRHEIYHDGSRVTPELVDRYWTATHQPGTRWAMRSLLAGYLNINIREEFRRLERPVTLIWGQQAHGVPLSHAEAFLKTNPDAELEIFSQAGQVPHDERAEDFNRLIVERMQAATMEAGQLPTLDKDQG